MTTSTKNNTLFEQLKALYQEAFPEDSEEFRQCFFDSVRARDRVACTLIEDGQLSAMAFVGLKLAKIGSRAVRLPLISAVAVKEEKRGQGKGAELMRKLLRGLKEKGAEFAALYPEIGHDFYTQFGFVTVSHMEERTVKLEDNCVAGQDMCEQAQPEFADRRASKDGGGGNFLPHRIDDLSLDIFTKLSRVNGKFFSRFDNHFVYDDNALKRLAAEYAVEDIHLHTVMQDKQCKAYCFVDHKKKRLEHVIGCYDAVNSVREWAEYKFLAAASPRDGGEYCQIAALNADSEELIQLRQSNNFFFDKY